MSVKAALAAATKQEALAEARRRGRLAVPEVEAPELFAPPAVADGYPAERAEWERALRDLAASLAAIQFTLAGVDADEETPWRRLRSKLEQLESVARLLETGLAGSRDRTAVAFSHLPYLFDAPAASLPAADCEFDFGRQRVTLRQEEGWCARRDLTGSGIWWHLEPRGCQTDQAGSLEDVLAGKGSWVLTAGGSDQVVLHVKISCRAPVEANAVVLDLDGRVDAVKVLVDGEKSTAVDRQQTWFVFPRHEVSQVEVILSKNNYDSDAGKTHYFCLHDLGLYLNRYRPAGVYVSHALEVRGAEAALEADLALPEGAGADLYLGFQIAGQISWRRVAAGEWAATPAFGDKAEERFMYAGAPRRLGKLYELYRFEEVPAGLSLELYPAVDMWVVESAPAPAEAGTSLRDWVTVAAQAVTQTSFLDFADKLTLDPTRLYRLYTYVYVGPEDAGLVASWRPQPEGVPCGVYVNRAEQLAQDGRYDLALAGGWNLVELIVRGEGPFDPLLSFAEAAQLTAATRGAIRLVTPEELRYAAAPGDISLAAYRDGALYVNYGPPQANSIRYLVRYYTGQEDQVLARIMVAMRSATGDASPVLSGFTVKWR